MSHDEIDRLLSREDEILPSSGFAASVMDAVRREAAAPPPIPFPWKRALPLLVAAAFALVLTVVVLLVAVTHLGSSAQQTSAEWVPRLTAFLSGSITPAAGWTLLALALTAASVAVSWRLASGPA